MVERTVALMTRVELMVTEKLTGPVLLYGHFSEITDRLSISSSVH